MAGPNMADTTFKNQNYTLLSALGTICICFLFGANAVAVKISLNGFGVFTTLALRFFFGALLITIWAKFTGRAFTINKKQTRQVIIIGFIFGIQVSLYYYGIKMSNASRATLLINLQPFFILILAHFFLPDDRITIKKVAGISLGFIGLYFIFRDNQAVSQNFRQGDLLVLASSLIWASNMIYKKKIIHTFQTFQIVLYPMLSALPFLCLEAIVFDPEMFMEINKDAVLALLYQIFVTASFGFVVWNYLLKKYGVTALHSFVFIIPATGVFLGGLLLNEPITKNLTISLLLIISGIIIVHMKSDKIKFLAQS
jgi:drug/metabolite transporter (DMT)-like permease